MVRHRGGWVVTVDGAPEPVCVGSPPPPPHRFGRGRRCHTGADRRLVRPSASRRQRHASVGGSNGGQNPRRDELSVLAGDALGVVWDNPASRAHRIVVPTNEMRPPTPAELKSLLEFVAPRDRQLELFLTLAAVTGARRAQLLGLRWRNISLAARRISFCAGWVEGPDGPVLAPTKTKRRHVVDLDEQSCQLLANRAAAAASSSREAFISATTTARQRGSRTG